MGSTNKTTNYELSQFVGLDKPSWLSDYNGDMAKIDTAIKARSVEAGAAQTTADTANGKADALDTRMGTAENNITALQNASTTDHTQIATNTANISKNAQDIVQLDAKIGHTQITIGDHTVTGAIATLAGQGGVEADNVSYNNTTSGLTADDVQEAIDELAARPTVADASDVTFDNTGTTLQATNVEDAIKEVASTPASNVRWNDTTDYFEVFKNGAWVQTRVLAGVNTTPIEVFKNGAFDQTVQNGAYDANTTMAALTNGGHNPFVVSSGVAKPTGTDTSASTIVIPFDATNYRNVKIVKADDSVVNIDISAISGTKYLGVNAHVTVAGATTSEMAAYINSNATNFGTGADTHADVYTNVVYTSLGFKEITIEP